MTKVDFRSTNDTGDNDEASIQPITNSDATIAEALGRPDQRLRERTVELQAQHNAERLLRLYSQGYTLTATSAATITQWEGAYNGSSLGRILMIGGSDLVMLPMLGPGVTRSSSPALDDGDTNISATRYGYTELTFDNGGGVFATVRIVFDTTVTPGSTPWTALDPLAASWLTVSVVVSGTGVTAAISGTDPETERLGLIPGEAHITITAGSTTTANALISALPGLLPGVVLSVTLVDGDGAATVEAVDRQAVTSEPLVGHALRVTNSMLQTFFAASTDNRLRKGDTLAVHFGTDNERLTASALGRWSSLSANNLINVGRLPVYASKCIPLARVDMLDRLIWTGGAVQASGATTSFFPGTSKSVFSPSSIAKTDFTIAAGSVDAQLSSMANVVQGILDGDYPFHDFQQDGAFNQGIYAPQFRAGLTYGAGQEIDGAAGVFESRGTGRIWAHTDTDTSANPGTMYQLRVDSDRSGNTGNQFLFELVKTASESEPTVAMWIKKQGAANVREFLVGNPVDGFYTYIFPTDDDALASAHVVAALGDGLTIAAGFGPATVYRVGGYASNEPSSLQDLVRVGGEYVSSTAGAWRVDARYDSALTEGLYFKHGSAGGLRVYNQTSTTNAVTTGLRVASVNASRVDGHGVGVELQSGTSNSTVNTLGAVRAKHVSVSSQDAVLEFGYRDAGTMTYPLGLGTDGLVMDGEITAELLTANASVGAPTVVADTQFVGHNVAYAWAKVKYASSTFTYEADATFGFDTGIAINTTGGPGLAILTLEESLPRSASGTGVACVLVTPTGSAARTAAGEVTSGEAGRITVYLAQSGTPTDFAFNVMVFSMR